MTVPATTRPAAAEPWLELSAAAAEVIAHAVEAGDLALIEVRDAARRGSITAATALTALRRRGAP
jgi:hypothetical protein